jgi:hypothetical protein
MRSSLSAAAAAMFLFVAAGCVPQPEGGVGHPNPVIVREFAVSPRVITLDPSFGFSLYRGSAGVPARTRAASVGRAAAFSLADAIATQLGSLGYDVIRSDSAEAEPGGRAIIVTGSFSQIDEGRRRQGAHVGVDVEVSYQTAGGPPQRLTAFHHSARAGPGGGVNAAAAAVGRTVAGYASDLARANNWPAAPR